MGDVCGQHDSRDLLCTDRCETGWPFEGRARDSLRRACWSADIDSFRVLNRDVNGEKLVCVETSRDTCLVSLYDWREFVCTRRNADRLQL